MKKLLTIVFILLSFRGYSQTKEEKTNSLVLLAYTSVACGVTGYLAHRSGGMPPQVNYFTIGVPLASLVYVGYNHKKELKHTFMLDIPIKKKIKYTFKRIGNSVSFRRNKALVNSK